MNITELLFPKLCVGCGKFGTYFCQKCINEIKQQNLICPVCERDAHGGATHPLCKSRYSLDGLWYLGIYSGALQKTIQKLKYRWVGDLALVLVDLTLEYWARYNPQFIESIKKDQGKNWMIVPVPLHYLRQNWRGFNQASLLGQLLSKKLGLGYQEYLQRTHHTKPQVELKSLERKKNIKGVFKLNTKYPIMNNVLLIDDVWTTGATLKECCYVLKRSGVKRVWAITLAR